MEVRCWRVFGGAVEGRGRGGGGQSGLRGGGALDPVFGGGFVSLVSETWEG